MSHRHYLHTIVKLVIDRCEQLALLLITYGIKGKLVKIPIADFVVVVVCVLFIRYIKYYNFRIHPLW